MCLESTSILSKTVLSYKNIFIWFIKQKENIKESLHNSGNVGNQL